MKKVTAFIEALGRLVRRIRRIKDSGVFTKKWIVRRYADQAAFLAGTPYNVSSFEQNVLLNEGIAEMWDLIIGAGGTAFSNANSYIGIGDSDTAAAAAQTGLQAATNKYYAAMAATYPSRSSQTVTWRGVVDGDHGNHAWKEFTVANGNSDSGKNMNRKVSDQGTKISGQVWTVDLAITLS